MAKRTKRYGLPAVERIELSERRFSLRTALAAVGVAVALAALALALTRLLQPENGWREIESDGSRGIHCGGDFTFSAEVRGAAEAKRLSLAWTEATAKAHNLFTVDSIDAIEPNLAYLNAHPNEDVAVDPALWRALKTAAEGGRYIFLGPIYEQHRSLCASQSDAEAALVDPLKDADAGAFCAAAAAYARDAASVDLAFPAENIARLNVSPEYAVFLKENGCVAAVDFGWMKNAFIIDCLADCVQAAGLGRGAIASRDGFVRCLDASGERYSLDLYERRDGKPFRSGILSYAGPAALVTLRGFRAAPSERDYYVYENGETRAPHIAPDDGLARASVEALTGASRELGCGELLSRLLPVFIAEDFRPEAAADVALICPEAGGWASTDPSFSVAAG